MTDFIDIKEIKVDGLGYLFQQINGVTVKRCGGEEQCQKWFVEHTVFQSY